MKRFKVWVLAAFVVSNMVWASCQQTPQEEPPPPPENYSLAVGEPTEAYLNGITTHTRRLVSQGKQPIIIFDLDGTLFRNGTRTKRIWLDYARANQASYPDLVWKLEKLDPLTLPYRVKTSLPGLGITDEAQTAGLMQAWVKGFFSNEYQPYDVPLQGSVEYVNNLYELGGLIVYLTGRDAPRMLQGGVKSLQDSGFPVGVHRTELMFKPDKAVEDSLFKVNVFDYIESLGEVVGCFENEPGNINSMHDRFPRAQSVFVDTNHRPEAPPVSATIPAIESFRLP
ncbi:MAG: HAD family hydrolase [Candidatus Eisenbacteria bacterium]|uniref:HAD family hydrolase n=1 Tax=Eiseniibacteriota bacterium TaxID=2212470 RepID=A0A7Y2EDN2_UNCEI|nr:HAD family hydrolase [Candidatus Eisenbacteria bacterium]